jgi:LysM repeat protein
VQSGDNLTTVARRHNTTVNDLKAENNLRTDRLLVGQILKLPRGSSRPTTTSSAPSAPIVAVPTPRPTPGPMVEASVPESTPDVDPSVVDAAPEAAEDPLVDKPFTIVVMEGDTLESIAANYVVSVEKIRELNNLSADAVLTPGQKLEMPPGLY